MLELDLRLRRDDFELAVQGQLGDGLWALFGPSGAGKSSLLQLIAGLLRPQRGRLVLCGEVLADAERGLFVPPHLRRVALVFQDTRLFPHQSVRGNLRFALRHARATPAVGLDALIALLELEPLLERRPHRLSGGEAQRVALGRALLSAPRLLLLDEPLAALDRRLRAQILPLLQKIHAQTRLPMLYVSHDLSEVLQLTDRMLVLHEGRVAGQGRYRDLVLQGQCAALNQALVNVLPMQIVEHDVAGGMTGLALASSPPSTSALLRAPLCQLDVGAQVSVALRPEDIALALAPVVDTSIQNQLRATVTKLVPRDGQFLLELDVGLPLLAEVTRRTADHLQLRQGMELWCLIKSNAIKFVRG